MWYQFFRSLDGHDSNRETIVSFWITVKRRSDLVVKLSDKLQIVLSTTLNPTRLFSLLHFWEAF